jgi:hypothetical protein
MKAILDIDNTIRDLVGRMIHVFKLELPNEIIEVKPTYDVSEWTSIGNKIYDFWFKKYVNEIYEKASPIADAFTGVNILRSSGFKIILASSQPNNLTKSATTKWLADFGLYFDELHYTAEKHKIKGELFVDDYTENLIMYKKLIKNSYVVAYDQPWNRDWDGLRIKNWYEIIDIALKIKEEKK